MTTQEVIARLDWASIETQLDEEGYAILPGLLSEGQVRNLVEQRGSALIDRRDSLAAEDLGRGDLFFFGQKPPPLVAALRASLLRAPGTARQSLECRPGRVRVLSRHA